MTPKQKIELRMSEVRQKLNGFAAAETLTESEQAESDALAKEFGQLETRLRAAIVAEPAADPPADPPAVDPQKTELRARVEVRDYLLEAMTGRTATGAAAELRAEVLGAEAREGLLPWEALLPTREVRADAATVGPTDVGVNQQAIIPRVFADGVTQFLGVTMPTVGVGEAVYTVITGGATAQMRAVGAEKDAEVATFEAFTLGPVRLTARYLLRVEDLNRLRGMEDALRADLRGAISDAMDNQVLNGSGAAPQVNGILNEVAAVGNAPNLVVTFSDMVQNAAAAVDGKYAGRLGEVRMLVGPATYRVAASLFLNNGDMALSDYLQRNSAGFRAGYHVPVPSSDIQSAVTFATRGEGSAVAPVWEGLELIRDPYSGAETGEVSITAVALWNFKVVREAPYKQPRFKVA